MKMPLLEKQIYKKAKDSCFCEKGEFVVELESLLDMVKTHLDKWRLFIPVLMSLSFLLGTLFGIIWKGE